MRDLERWKDKVELSLDGRQIFFLFFGSAVTACLLFVGGVVVGKRIAEHAARSAGSTAEDPLAALDRLGAAAAVNDGDDDGLTFHQALAPTAKPIATAGIVDRHGRTPARHDPAAAVVLPSLPSLPQAPPVAESAGPGKRFTLQLSAFVEKEDAVGFMQKMQSAGYRPFLIQSDIPGRGVFYRVRVGDYASRRAATEAKSDLERKQHVVAYVAKL